MKSEWKEYSLGELYEVHNGLSKGRKFFGRGYPFLSFSTVFNRYFLPEKLTDLVESTEKERETLSIRRGDIFITRTSETYDELGMSCVALKNYPNATFNGFTKRLRPHEEGRVLPEFIGYFLRGPQFRRKFEQIANVTTRASLSNGDLLNMVVSLPPLPIQRKIASILSSLDDKIETNNAICRNLEEQAKALYKSWFVDFEPFHKDVFEESEIGLIPRGWRVSKMSDFFPVVTGKKNANVASKIGQYPFFSCSQEILWTDDYSFEGKAILVAGNGDFNVKRYNGKFEAYQRTYVLIPEKPDLAGILYYAISKGLSDITIGARGSVINFITKGNIADYKIAIPDNLIDLPIITTINSLNETIDNLKAEIMELSQLRNALLPRLMSGELTVENIN